MANTIPVTQKPVPSSVSKDAYVLGIQDNGSGQQALYRLPINDVRGNGANEPYYTAWGYKRPQGVCGGKCRL